MKGRRSVWSDKRVIKLIEKFVPTTDEVWRLQHNDDAECEFFQQMANHGHYKPTKSTQQGIYVCSPSGKFLASLNSNDPERVMETMKKGLAAWNRLKPMDRKLADKAMVASGRRMESVQPKGGMVLAMYARDIPKSKNPSAPCGKKWNRDTAWFTKGEIEKMMPKPMKKGETFELPKQFIERLVALHMTDTVNGQTDHFQYNEVTDSKIIAKVVEVDGSKFKLELSGTTKSKSKKSGSNRSPRGVITKLLGKAEFNSDKKQFSQFEIVAVGHRWGYTPFNDRLRLAEGSNPIGFVFQIADADEPPTVPASIWAYPASIRNRRN